MSRIKHMDMGRSSESALALDAELNAALNAAVQRCVDLRVARAERAAFIGRCLLAAHGKHEPPAAPAAPAAQAHDLSNMELQELEDTLTAALNNASGREGWPLRAVAEQLGVCTSNSGGTSPRGILLREVEAAPPSQAPPPWTTAATASEWGAAGWLASEGVEWPLANALLGEEFGTGDDELEAFRALGRSARLEDELLARLATAIGPLAAMLAPRLRALAVEAATSGEMQDKFTQETRGMLEYGSLNVFFGGLEAIAGSPNPKVLTAMAAEHTERGDSDDVFTTSNYDLRTTSKTEWAFVATPSEPPEGGWPIEQKLHRALAGEEGADLEAIRMSGACHRMPLPIADLQAAMEERANSKLRTLHEPMITKEETMGLRLYTGPLFVKYNGVLRGLNSSVPFLRNTMIQLCCAKVVADAHMGGAKVWEEPKGGLAYDKLRAQVNSYTTTLHVSSDRSGDLTSRLLPVR